MQNNMKIAQANVRSINTTVAALDITCMKLGIKIMCLSEIWRPKDGLLDKTQALKTWQWYTKIRQKGKSGGGVAIAAARDVKVMKREDMNNTAYEAVWCNIYIKGMKIALGSVYIPPGNKTQMKAFLNDIEVIRGRENNIIITGDFNARHESWDKYGENILGRMLAEALASNNLIVWNSEQPTHKNGTIDLTLITPTLEDLISDWKTHDETTIRCDHKLISFLVGGKQEKEVKTILNIKKADWEEWSRVTDEVFTKWMEDEEEKENSIDELYESLKETLDKTAKEVIGYKEVCLHSKTWWNPQVKEQQKRVKEARKRYKHRRDPRNRMRLDEEKERYYVMIEEAKGKKEASELKELNTKDNKKLWRTVNNIRKPSQKSCNTANQKK
ncbi:uncharacterized protein LOC118418304 [Branchiostoma floridae]|uniref:Uncharacterized protein LOC118418304 n=1 Tax=Branchiostoma floridae TaxID=7739 RepID=A0A9J7LDL8_BRAFL|nr:uncharacterized protein LOC118418304 [Branchiostoma floridae]